MKGKILFNELSFLRLESVTVPLKYNSGNDYD